MKKHTSSISINVLSAFIILLCVFMSFVGSVNSWFTSIHEQGVQIVVDTGSLNLKLYQNSSDNEDNLIYTRDDELQSTTPKYVNVSGVIKPDDEIDLVLILSNKDTGSSGVYVRYKFELFMREESSDTLLTTNILGYQEQSSDAENKKTGFQYDGSEWYYYKDGNGDMAVFAKGVSATLLTDFVVPYSEFINNDGSMKIKNSNSVYIKLTVQGSTSASF